MYRLIQFIRRYFVVLLFIILEVGAINYYVKSTSYNRAKLHMASAKVTGGFNNFFASIGDYFTLRRDNRRLLGRLASVENELASYYQAEAMAQVEHVQSKYLYSTAKVISNSINRQNNYFVINKGRLHNIEENMAVLSIEGNVAGYVEICSDNYAVCMSMLNRDFRIGGRIKGKEYFGSIFWDGVSPQFVTLSDIPRYAPLVKGDTIVSAFSARFPQNSPIGVIESYEEAGDGTYFEIKVRLGIDLIKLSDVMLVKFSDSEELNDLAGEYFPDGRQ